MIYCGGICPSHLKCFMFSIESQLFYVASSHLHSKITIGVLYQFNGPAGRTLPSLLLSVVSKPGQWPPIKNNGIPGSVFVSSQ